MILRVSDSQTVKLFVLQNLTITNLWKKNQIASVLEIGSGLKRFEL